MNDSVAFPSPQPGAGLGPFGLLGGAGGPGRAFLPLTPCAHTGCALPGTHNRGVEAYCAAHAAAQDMRRLRMMALARFDQAMAPEHTVSKLSLAATHLGRAEAFREAIEILETT